MLCKCCRNSCVRVQRGFWDHVPQFPTRHLGSEWGRGCPGKEWSDGPGSGRAGPGLSFPCCSSQEHTVIILWWLFGEGGRKALGPSLRGPSGCERKGLMKFYPARTSMSCDTNHLPGRTTDMANAKRPQWQGYWIIGQVEKTGNLKCWLLDFCLFACFAL